MRMLGHEGKHLVDVSLRSLLADPRALVPRDTLLEVADGPLMEWTIVHRDGNRLPVEVRYPCTRLAAPTSAVLRDVASAQSVLIEVAGSQTHQRLQLEKSHHPARGWSLALTSGPVAVRVAL
jgi:hypothetical protein